MKEKVKRFLKKALEFCLNPRLLLCLGAAWMVTNGWSYIMLALGTFFRIPWMISTASAYLLFLWLPVSPEKIVTVALALLLLKLLFPQDEKTLAVLSQMYAKTKSAIGKRKKKDQE